MLIRNNDRRDDLRKILLLGSGPIVIGQAASLTTGTQAKHSAKKVVLVNSNPTI